MDFAFHYAAGTRQVDDTRFKEVEACTMVRISVENASKLWISSEVAMVLFEKDVESVCGNLGQ